MALNIIYITAKDENEAKNISKILVAEKLVACANIHNISSIYEWNGKIQDDREAVIIAKTTDKLTKKVMKRVKGIHSYKIPCILSFLAKGNKEYVDWVEKMTKNKVFF
ncbi:divalent-cation tolerance protein CutA [Candidatus Woesearchaeota archaeon]|nr:divalent-cation tolerance protein CutA [Candidatus Woesearchaeota archaeon]